MRQITCFAKIGTTVWGGSFDSIQLWTLAGNPGPTLNCGASCIVAIKSNGKDTVWTSGGVASNDLTKAADVLVWWGWR